MNTIRCRVMVLCAMIWSIGICAVPVSYTVVDLFTGVGGLSYGCCSPRNKDLVMA